MEVKNDVQNTFKFESDNRMKTSERMANLYFSKQDVYKDAVRQVDDPINVRMDLQRRQSSRS